MFMMTILLVFFSSVDAATSRPHYRPTEPAIDVREADRFYYLWLFRSRSHFSFLYRHQTVAYEKSEQNRLPSAGVKRFVALFWGIQW
jgi:hypothetical protein